MKRYVTILRAVEPDGEVVAGIAVVDSVPRERAQLMRDHPGARIETVQVEASGALERLLDTH